MLCGLIFFYHEKIGELVLNTKLAKSRCGEPCCWHLFEKPIIPKDAIHSKTNVCRHFRAGNMHQQPNHVFHVATTNQPEKVQFSLHFERVGTIGKVCQGNSFFFGTQQQTPPTRVANDYEFSHLGDVKISQTCSVLVTCDEGTKRILFHDLQTHQHKRTLQTPDVPHCLCIETESGCDFLYYSSHYHVYKFNLNQLVSADCCEPVWRSGEFTHSLLQQQGSRPKMNQFHHAQGLAVCHSKMVFNACESIDENVLLVCDQTQFEVKIVRCTTGQVIGRFDVSAGQCLMKGGGPVGIVVNSKGNLIIIDQGVKLYGKKDNGNVIVCDCGNSRIVVLDENGTFIKEYRGVSGESFNPKGVCIDTRTGYLYIAERTRIQVYK